MRDDLISLDELVAHRGSMRLVDRLIEISETHAIAEAEIRPDNLFFSAERNVPAYVGLEMMAQTIAAIDGKTQRNAGKPPKIGFLLGCRRYNAASALFAEGDLLTIFAKMVFTDGAMFSFDCRIACAGAEIANASLNVYAPANPKTLLDRHLA
jgi:predicted hotdog family 3-hydroxylacyl-ACP dehydratase